ncbi:MAG: hypothetical protein ABI688_00515 [Bacteroidota bacterium]
MDDIDAAIVSYPQLSVQTANGIQILSGELPIIDQSGYEWDRYQVELYPSPLYPFRFPYLFETRGRIPRIMDWHIYTDTGSCCVDITPSEILHCREGLSLADYIRRFAIPYFANQTYRIREGYYKNGEYSHGGKGMLEFYMPVLRCDDPVKALQLLELYCSGAAGNKSIFHFCFCGSRKKMMNCHRKAVEVLNNIGIAEVRLHTFHVRKYLSDRK